jgi:hypothetical protein
MSSSCQKPEPENSKPRGTKRKRNQQELQQDDNAHAYTSLESTMPVQSTYEMGDNIGIDGDRDMDEIMDDDPSPMIEQV